MQLKVGQRINYINHIARIVSIDGGVIRMAIDQIFKSIGQPIGYEWNTGSITELDEIKNGKIRNLKYYFGQDKEE